MPKPRLLRWILDADAGWIRLGSLGPGIAYTKNPPLFSERYGYKKPFMKLFGYRFFWLEHA